MQLTNELVHDEINLFRLVRRLEKSVQVEGDDAEVWVRSQKELQKVKYARKLVKNVEGSDSWASSSEHKRRLNSVKTALDNIESFLTDRQTKYAPAPSRPPSLLDQLPTPQDADQDDDEEEGQMTPKARGAPSPLDLSTDNFLLSPPEHHQSLPSSGLVSAIPALMSAEPLDIPEPFRYPSSSIAFAPGSSTTALDTTPALKHRGTEPSATHKALQEELSNQLAVMSAQLKRNALHFASNLEKDKAAVEEAQSKIEGNLTFMEVQRARLKNFAGKSGGTTWLTLGIVLFVILVFVIMIGVIRLARL